MFTISKAIVIYYSLEQETKTLAEMISDVSNIEIKELVPIEPEDRRDYKTYFWKGKKYDLANDPKLEDLEISIDDYDLIFIGTPIWELTYSPPVKSFFNNYEVKNKKIAVFYTHEGEKGDFLEKFKDLIGKNELVAYIDFYDPLNSNLESVEEEICKWAEVVMKKELG